MPETIDEIKKYIGPFSGPQMDQIFYEILNYTSERYAKGTANSLPVAPGTPGYQDNSLFYKNQAQTAAANATSSANSAANNAQAAADDAQTAQEAAETATSSATAAANSETAAAQSASEAATSAEAASIALKLMPTINISGAIASFSDGGDDVPVVNLKTNLDIVQPLHGQANPYPAGGGKNKLPNPATSKTENGITFTVNSDGSVKAVGTASAVTYLQLVGSSFTLAPGSYILNGSTGGSGSSYNIYGAYKESGGATQYIVSMDGDSPVLTVTENTAITLISLRIHSGATVNTTFYPMLRLSTESADYAPYENICPIIPHTEAEISRTGKNLFDYSALQTGGLDVNTGEETTQLTARRTDWIRAYPSTVYTISGQTGNLRVFLYDIEKKFISSALLANGASVTTTASTVYMRISGGEANYTEYVQFEKGPYTAFEPYVGQQYVIDFNGNVVYGGELDVTMGVLTARYARQVFNGSEATWGFNAYETSNRATYPLSNASTGTSTNNVALSYVAPNASPSVSQPEPWTANISTSGILRIGLPTTITSVDDWKAYLASNPLEVVYPLATPLTIQLDPVIVRTLLGDNTIFSDSGAVDLTYKADLGLYIDDHVAELQALILDH